MTIAFDAFVKAIVAIATKSAALHKERAFQASSPKTSGLAAKRALFFVSELTYGDPAAAVPVL